MSIINYNIRAKLNQPQNSRQRGEMNIYQQAKTRIAELSPFSGHYPDSLTRRDDTLIARRSYPFTYHPTFASMIWASNIKELFPEARIIRNSVDSKNNARCYFKLPEVQDVQI